MRSEKDCLQNLLHLWDFTIQYGAVILKGGGQMVSFAQFKQAVDKKCQKFKFYFRSVWLQVCIRSASQLTSLTLIIYVPQDERSRVRLPVASLEIFKWPNPSVRIQYPQGQPSLSQKWVPRNFVRGEVWTARTADNSAILVVPNITETMEAQHSIPPPKSPQHVKGKLYLLLLAGMFCRVC